MEDAGSDAEDLIGETVCICGTVYEDDVFMIQCDICRNWLHGDCIKIDELSSSDIDKYHCPTCEPLCGPSIMKVETNWHRHDKTDPQATYKPLQVGTKLFVDELSKRIFSTADDIIMKVSGKQLTLPYLNQSGFNHPILVTDKDGLTMTTPQAGFNIDRICDYLGDDYPVDIIDVHRQQACQMSLAQFAAVFNTPYPDRVLNCLSLEVSETAMADVFSPPLVARKLCWVNNVWPSGSSLPYPKPQVQKYCIMSMENSFTDFHIDFGGTSVWYHVYQGEKYFYLIRPTPANISLYERWTRLSTQSETFLGDMVDRCYLLKLTQGQTIFIPTGWIHAVYTPVNSIVFGGNFLHSLNIQLQLRIYELENRLKDPPKFRFPSFEVVHWLAAGKLKKDLADLNSDNTPCPINLLNGIRSLVTTLKSWITDINHPVISDLDCATTLKDLTREVKNAERISLKVNPPKPERESNRRRKKKTLDEDFIDISDPGSLYLLDYQPQTTTPKKGRGRIEKVIAVKSKPIDHLPSFPFSSPPLPSLHPHLPSYGAPSQPLPGTPGPQSYLYSEPTVSPLKLSLSVTKNQEYLDGAIIDNRGEIPISKRAEESAYSGYDLTDRDSVRLLLATRKQAELNKSGDLNSQLSEALTDFGGEQEGLVIDEKAAKKFKKSIKLRLSVSSSSEPVVLAEPSVQPPYPQLDSPSTRDAVDGMLFMSQKAKLHPKIAMKASLRKKISTAPKRLKEEKINKVHQDEDFIYPGLDVSDDEELPVRNDDESWNPKIKMSTFGPKKERPIRESAKNIAIEKGLKHAAENRNSFARIKSSGKIVKKRSDEHKMSPKSLALSFDDKNRGRKVCSTAKQRLGKILGLKF